MEDNAKIKLGGLWQNTAKDGSHYYTGRIGSEGKLLLLKNSYKKDLKDPDLILYVVKGEKKQPAPAKDFLAEDAAF